jgi:hypothetical protein
VLAKEPSEIRPLIAMTIPLLADPGLHKEAKRALSRIANSITGQLVDALLDTTTRPVVRRRIPRVLGACNNQRAADGLLLGIADTSFEVRYECSKALVRVLSHNPQLNLPREALKAAVLYEAQIESVSNTDEVTSQLALELIADRRERRLRHIFAVLSLDLGREPLQIAFRALHHEDQRHRGTALEYLETVLPTELREALHPFLGAAQPLSEPRPAADILADLTRAMGQTAASSSASLDRRLLVH